MMRWVLAGALALFAFVLPAHAVAPGQLGGCQYLATPLVLSDQQTAVVQCDSAGNQQVDVVPGGGAAAGITPVVSASAEASHVIKSSAGNLFGLSVSIGTTSGYVLVLNAASDPGNGSVAPLFCYPVVSNGTNGSVTVTWGSVPAVFSTGIVLVFSTTGCFTETKSATAFFSGAAK